MISARALLNDALARGTAANEREERETPASLEALFDRLLSHPEELEALDEPTTRGAHASQRYAARALPSLESGTFRYRNASVPDVAEWIGWAWPPETYAAYDAFAAHGPAGLRVLGECWGMSTLASCVPGGRLLVSGDPRTASSPRVSWATGTRDVVRCLLGATYDDVHDFLEREGDVKCLANQPGFSGLSVAGNLAVGGHGSGLGMGALESLVRSVVIGPIVPGGSSTRLQRAIHGATFDRAVAHLGRLGPVVEVELAVTDTFRIAEERKRIVLGGAGGSWRSELTSLLTAVGALHTSDSTVHSVELWIAPYPKGDELTCALGIRRRTLAPISTDVTRPWALRYKALQALAHIAAVLVAKARPSWIRGILRKAVSATESGRVVMKAREGLDFGAPNVNRMGSIEAAIDISDGVARGVTALEKTIDLLADLATRDRFVFSPMGVRFVGPGPAAGLSPHVGREATMHIELPTFAEDGIFHGDEVYPPLQRLLASAELGGRPHLGQRVYLRPDELRELWPSEQIEYMRDLVAQYDPGNRFANSLVDAILDIT